MVKFTLILEMLSCLSFFGDSIPKQDLVYQFKLENFECSVAVFQENDSTMALKLNLKNTAPEPTYVLKNAVSAAGYILDERIIDISLMNWFTSPMHLPWMHLDLLEIPPGESQEFIKRKKGKVDNLERISFYGIQIIESKIEDERIKRKLKKSIKRGAPKIWMRYFYDQLNPYSFGHTITIKK